MNRLVFNELSTYKGKRGKKKNKKEKKEKKKENVSKEGEMALTSALNATLVWVSSVPSTLQLTFPWVAHNLHLASIAKAFVF